jgi:hypothetical protein
MPASHPVYVPGARTAFRGPLESAALIAGGVLLAVGVLGLATGAGYALPSLVDLFFGAVALPCARTSRGARRYLVAGGVGYLAGYLGAATSPGHLVHLGVAVAMVVLGILLSRRAG